jgi:uncharacterized Ntn-hydrolase superfamily protein
MTFSLLGRCPRTGQFGAVVTTSAVGVGARVPFARAGIGAVLTQHRTDPRLGPLGLDLRARGCTAQQTIDAIVAATPHRAWRQLAAIDAAGRTAHYDGAHVRAAISVAHGRDCVGAGNILRNAEIAPAMVAAFEADPSLPLATRLVAAIQAGEDAGGETAAVVSASLLVVEAESFPLVDLRVDAHDTPLAELARLWALYEPTAADYVRRAIDPDFAATYIAPPPKAV